MDKLYIDVSTLQESQYTGIPMVTARLCAEALGDASVEPAFFFGRYEISAQAVEALLGGGFGRLFAWSVGCYRFAPCLPEIDTGRRVYGLHTNSKLVRRMFPVEGSIVHDLTTVVCPQYHNKDTNQYHNQRWLGDLMSDDIIFAASHSTATDIRTFFPETSATPIVVTHWGVDWSHIDASKNEPDPVEPYILVLGTLEPRKNLNVMLDLLEAHPQIARMYRIVISGRFGWGDKLETHLKARGLGSLVAAGRIVQAGFVSETAKFALLRNAAALVYPSVYEGFGLPVAEAISLGVPVVTTAASSLPEVGGDFAFYFDGETVTSLLAALTAALQQRRVLTGRSGESLEEWKARFSWARAYRLIRDGFMALPNAHLSTKNQRTSNITQAVS
ncbi:glycosyltransferase family 1 protein [Caulobacter sp. S45]|uniref:glycosyltransferase family 4 protein n=1 Tax=Caulobacter sp. S45 TaxID=1641861 RepID=UPI0015753942|nr:glycosyltransferase family 1 protein [Caulobacter sp. S45]